MGGTGHLAQVLRGFSIILLGDLAARSLSYLLLPVYLHLMDKAEVGTFTYLLTITQLLAQLTLIGLYTAQSKLMGEWTARGEERILSGGILLAAFIPAVALGLALQVFPGLLGLVISDPAVRASLGPLVPLGIVSGALSFLYSNTLMATGRYRLAVVVSLLRVVLSNAAALAVLMAGTREQAGARLACIWAIDALLFLAFLGHYWRLLDLNRWRAVPWRRLALISLPVWLNGLISIPLNGYDRVILERSVDKGGLAEFNIAMSIAGVLGVLFSSFNAIWFPAVLAETDLRVVIERTRRLVLLATATFTALGVVIAAGTWCGFALGVLPARYQGLMPLLAPLLLAQVLGIITHLLGIVFFALERTWLALVVSIPVSSAYLLLCLQVIPASGVAGAAWLQLAPGILSCLGSLLVLSLALRARGDRA